MKNKNTQGNEIKEDAKSFVSITLKQTKDVKVKKIETISIHGKCNHIFMLILSKQELYNHDGNHKRKFERK